MAWFSGSNRSPIGLDIGVRCIKAVQLQRVGGAWQLSAATAVPRVGDDTPIAEDELARFVGVLERQGFAGRDVVSAVPGPWLIGGMLELPPRASGAPLDQIAQMELARMHKRQPDSFKVVTWDLPASVRSTATTHVMAAACDHGEADRLVDRFEAVGLNVLALDTAAWSLARACGPHLKKMGSNVVGLLDVGWTAARVVVLYDGMIIYERAIADAGIQAIRSSLIERTKLEPSVVDHLIQEEGVTFNPDLQTHPGVAATVEAYVERIGHELQSSFSYASHRYRDATFGGLIVAGGGAGGDHGLCQRLKDIAGFDTQPAALAGLVGCPPQLDRFGNMATLTVALGLAQHGRGAA